MQNQQTPAIIIKGAKTGNSTRNASRFAARVKSLLAMLPPKMLFRDAMVIPPRY
jgi:hypothetical protein